ncbi:MAG: hypothetical protein QM479_06060 [Pseudomonadota bacterium]
MNSFKKVVVDQSFGELRYLDLNKYLDEILLSPHPKFKKIKIKGNY